MPTHSRRAHTRKKTKDVAQHFLPRLRPFRFQLCWAALTMVQDAVLMVLRPWPLKVVIDRVLSHKPTLVPLLGGWLDKVPLDRLSILYSEFLASVKITEEGKA